MASLGSLSGGGLSLPVEVLEIMLSQLPHNFLITTCTLVCHHWCDVIQNPAFLPWKKLYYRFKLSPSSRSSSLLWQKDDDDDDDDGDDVLTTEQVVKRLCQRHDISSLSNCLVNIIRAVGKSHGVPQDSSPTMLRSHRLYQLAQDALSHLDPALLPRPHNLWHLVAAIVLLSHEVWDIHLLIRLLLQPGSLFSPCVVVESFYSLAVLLLHSTTSLSINLPMRYHYQVFYALYLYENDLGGAMPKEGVQAKQETHAGQQSMQGTPVIQYTHEQLRVINHHLQLDHVVKIIAFAGTGKTTTLQQLCQRRPDQRFLLVVYNKAIQEHCARIFPQNAQVKTAHSLAYAVEGRRFKAIGKFFMKLTGESLSNFLPKREGTGNRLRRVALAKNALERFLNSADEHLTLLHTPTQDKHGEQIDDDFRLKVILVDAELIWAEMSKCSPSQKLPMTQDGQLKLWQLRHPTLHGYDVVMIDEGQDMNPSMLDIFLRQSCAKVIVGDPHQQIYSFRGAINALESVPSTHTFYLTQSFRFGPEVSYMAQCVLDTLNRKQRHTLVGGHKKDSIIGPQMDGEAVCPSIRNRTAYLGRSNLEVYQMALYICQQRENASLSMAFAGELRNYDLDTVTDIYKLSQVQQKKGTAQSLGIKNKLVAKFKSVCELKNYANNLDDKELYNKILMYEFSNTNTPQHIQLLKTRCSSSQDVAVVTFSTIHKAKGLEWDHVVLLKGSVLALYLPAIANESIKLRRDEINLLYVSITRAKRFLTVNGPVLEILQLSKERREVLVSGKEVQEECRCTQCNAKVDGKQPIVTKVMGLQVLGRGIMQGGYLCHLCSTSPFRNVSFRKGNLVAALEPRQDYSRCARRILLSGKNPEDSQGTTSV